MPTGVMIHGFFVGATQITGKDGSPVQVLLISTGMDAHRIYMLNLLNDAYKIGDEMLILCRPYGTKNGGVGYGQGQIVKV